MQDDKTQGDNPKLAPKDPITPDNVDDKFLAEMGLVGLDEDSKQEALQNLLFTINLNVGKRVQEQLTDQQVEEFERLSRPGADIEKLIYWIALNVPNHAELIEEETIKLRDEALDFVDDAMAPAEAQAPEAKL